MISTYVDNGVEGSLNGDHCDVLYTTPSGALKQPIFSNTIYVCENDDDISKCAGAVVSFSDIWKTFRIGGNLLSGGQSFWYGRTQYPLESNNVNASVGIKNWEYSSSEDTVVQKVNTVDYEYLVSPNSFSNYELEVRLYSTGADDDHIGIILSYVDDDGSGNPRYLAAIRSPNNSNEEVVQRNHWFVADSTCAVCSTADEQIRRISINNPQSEYAGNWSGCGAGTCIKAVRTGSKIELWTKPFLLNQTKE